MKKFWLFVSTLVVFSLVVVACAPKAPEATKVVPTTAPVPTNTAEPTQIEPTMTAEPTTEPTASGPVKIVILPGWDLAMEQRTFNTKLQEQFNQSHADIQIEFLRPDNPMIQLRSLLNNGTAPDIVIPVAMDMIDIFYDEWLDLSPYIQRDNYDLTRFFDRTVEVNTFGEKGLIGLPMCLSPQVLIYNADLFDAAGVPYPPHQWEAPYADGEPWTYMKMVEVAKKLTLDENGNDASSPDFNPEEAKQWGLGYWYQDMNPFSFTLKLGAENGKSVSNDNKTSLLLTQPYIDAFTFLHDAIWTWHIIPRFGKAVRLYSAYDAIGSNAIAMFENYLWQPFDWSEWSKNFHWDWAANPAWPTQKPAAVFDRDTFMLLKSSQHPDQAWEVIKWLYEPAQLAQLVKNYNNCLPGDKELAAQWMAEKSTNYPGVDFQVVVDSLNYVKGNPDHADWDSTSYMVNEAVYQMHQAMLDDANLDPLTALTETDKKVQALLDK